MRDDLLLKMTAGERMERIKLRQRQIGDALRRYRRMNNVSTEVLGELLGRRRQTIAQIERGEASLDLPSLEILMEVLEIPLDEIMPDKQQAQAKRVRKVELPAHPGEKLLISIEIADSN